MDGGKEKQNAMDLKKKRKTTTTMWRPVYTKAISNEGELCVTSTHHLWLMIDPKSLPSSTSSLCLLVCEFFGLVT